MTELLAIVCVVAGLVTVVAAIGFVTHWHARIGDLEAQIDELKVWRANAAEVLRRLVVQRSEPPPLPEGWLTCASRRPLHPSERQVTMLAPEFHAERSLWDD